MTTITIDFTPETQAGFAAVAAHTSTDKVTPVLMCVRVTAGAFLATDRYTAVRYRHTDTAGETNTGITLTADAVKWITGYKIGRDKLTLTLTHDTETSTSLTTISSDMGVISAMHAIHQGGNYPSIERLIPDYTECTVDIEPQHLGADILEHVVKSAKIIGRASKVKNQPIRFQYAETSTGKLAPVRVSIGDRFDGVMQPVTPVRR